MWPWEIKIFNLDSFPPSLTLLHWGLALDAAATALSKTALKTPAGSPLKITSMLQTCLSLVSLTHTCAVQGEGGRAVVLCGEQRGWRGRRKGVGFPLPWQQLQTHTIHSSYERLCAAVTRTLTRRQLRERSHISPPNPHTPSLSSSRKVWSCNEMF